MSTTLKGFLSISILIKWNNNHHWVIDIWYDSCRSVSRVTSNVLYTYNIPFDI